MLPPSVLPLCISVLNLLGFNLWLNSANVSTRTVLLHESEKIIRIEHNIRHDNTENLRHFLGTTCRYLADLKIPPGNQGINDDSDWAV